MIDIHAHILPGLDDGAADMDEALAMARLAVADGVQQIYATSHLTWEDANEETFSTRARLLEEVQRQVRSEGLNLEIQAGAEWMLDGALAEAVPPEGLLGQSRCVLVEINDFIPLAFVPEILSAMRSEGYVPILAHPERYREVRANSVQACLGPVVAAGGLLQVTAGSLTGLFGAFVRENALAIARAFPSALVLASDTHDAQKRVPGLSAGYRELDKINPGLSLRSQKRLQTLLAPQAF